jgi:hypothetical protein
VPRLIYAPRIRQTSPELLNFWGALGRFMFGTISITCPPTQLRVEIVNIAPLRRIGFAASRPLPEFDGGSWSGSCSIAVCRARDSLFVQALDRMQHGQETQALLRLVTLTRAGWRPDRAVASPIRRVPRPRRVRLCDPRLKRVTAQSFEPVAAVL